MDSAVIAAIISVLGAGFLAIFFFSMRGIKSEITELRREMHAEFAAVRAEIRALREDLTATQNQVARHDGVLAEHSRQLSQAAG